jgi:acyl-CoA synthetase (AMP-forming)/AMP-acid ligase II
MPSFTRIDAYLRYHAQQAPQNDLWISGEERFTYAKGEALVESVARALIGVGVKRGDHVSVFGKPGHEPIAIYLALGRIGGIYVGLNPKYKYEELAHIVADCAPVAIITTRDIDGEGATTIGAVISAHTCVKHDIGRQLGPMSWRDFLACGEGVTNDMARTIEAEVLPEDTALMVYTSGSTGKPKGAMLPHRGLTFVAPIVQDQAHFGTLATPRVLCALPINHVGAMVDICSNTIWAGGAIVFQADFDPIAMLSIIEAERITLFGGIPLMFMMMADLPQFFTTDYGSVEKVVVAGNAAPIPLVNVLEQVVKRPVITGYGLTECMGFSSFSDIDASAQTIATTIGKFDHRVTWRLVDEAGVDCPVGTVGEVQMMGDTVFSGYLNRPEATAEAFTSDGWFRTGDLGELLPDGNVRLVGRSREMFKSGGYNVYPLEVEQALEKVQGIAMAIVVPVPDALYSEVGVAFVVSINPNIDASALKQGVLERLANYKIPKRFEFVDALPMLPIGKVDRLAVKAMAIAMLKEIPQ